MHKNTTPRHQAARRTFARLGCALAWVLLSLVARPAAAQLGDFQPASASYEWQLPVTAAGGTLGFDTLKTGIGVPVALPGKTSFLLLGLNYQRLNVDYSAPTPLGLSQLHLLTVSSLLIHRFSPKWTGIVGTTYGIASDLAGPLTHQDLFVSGTLLGIYTWSPDLSLGAGIGYDQRTGKLLPLPLVALNWEPFPTFAIRGVIPANGYIAWRAMQPMTLELTEALVGQRYHLSDPDYAPHKVQLEYSVLKVGAGVRFHAYKFLHFELLGGLAVRRHFEVFADDQSQGTNSLRAGPYIGANIWVGLSGWRSDAPKELKTEHE